MYRRQREAVEIDADIAGGLPQQAHELAFGRLKRRIRHVVDEPDGKVHVGMLRTAEFILFAAAAPARGRD